MKLNFKFLSLDVQCFLPQQQPPQNTKSGNYKNSLDQMLKEINTAKKYDNPNVIKFMVWK